jgi:hypothetical protein
VSVGRFESGPLAISAGPWSSSPPRVDFRYVIVECTQAASGHVVVRWSSASGPIDRIVRAGTRGVFDLGFVLDSGTITVEDDRAGAWQGRVIADTDPIAERVDATLFVPLPNQLIATFAAGATHALQNFGPYTLPAGAQGLLLTVSTVSGQGAITVVGSPSGFSYYTNANVVSGAQFPIPTSNGDTAFSGTWTKDAGALAATLKFYAVFSAVTTFSG